MLQKYPHVRDEFLRYNTMISSSAPVEQLFSFGVIIRSAKHKRHADETFETLLLLKANDNITPKVAQLSFSDCIAVIIYKLVIIELNCRDSLL